jgi:hypothetical protein
MRWMQTHPTCYPTDLNDEEWDYIKSLVPTPKSGKGKRGRPIKLVYSGELICGVSNGMNRGATGQMSELGRRGKGAVEWCESREQYCSRSPGFGPGDGEA